MLLQNRIIGLLFKGFVIEPTVKNLLCRVAIILSFNDDFVFFFGKGSYLVRNQFNIRIGIDLVEIILVKIQSPQHFVAIGADAGFDVDLFTRKMNVGPRLINKVVKWTGILFPKTPGSVVVLLSVFFK